MKPALLQVTDLKMHFPLRGGVLRRQVGTVFAVDGVSFEVPAAETLGLVGESGCGKTTLGRAVMQLSPLTSGTVRFDGRNLSTLDRKTLREIRKDLQMIFQDPFESLNARHCVGDILAEPFQIHRVGTRDQWSKNVRGLLDRVGLPGSSVSKYPHEFSGGQRQRIGIARAIALRPKLIICDEPVSALDVSIQSQILNLLLELQAEMGLSFLFIAHDLAVVKHVSDRVAVMYLGKIVEHTDSMRLYRNPMHPYTKALIASIPVADPFQRTKKGVLRGDVPSPICPPPGCRFHTRCPLVIDRCRSEEPLLRPVPGNRGENHEVACHRAGEG